MIMGLPKTEPLLHRNDIIKCFVKINENVGVNWAMVRTHYSSPAGDSGREIFEKENLITRKIKRNKRASPGFRFGLANRVGPGSGDATMAIYRFFFRSQTSRFLVKNSLKMNSSYLI